MSRVRAFIASAAVAALSTCFLSAQAGCTSSVSEADSQASQNVTVDALRVDKIEQMTLHRLNQAEYRNSVRDLFGVESTIALELSPDGIGAGFDNNADALQISAADLDVYQRAAASLATTVLDAKLPARAKWVTCSLTGDSGSACVRSTLGDIAYHAWRRPLADGELDALVTVAQAAGADPEGQLRLGVNAVLLSPHFLFRVELDPGATPTTPHPLSGFELASRLSYFLWSSLPDDALLAAAQSGALTTDAGLGLQLDRMLADPKSGAMVDNFFGQWFWLRRAAAAAPDGAAFPAFSEPLRQDMLAESRAFFAYLLQANPPLADIMVAPYSFMNDRLATYYGLDAPQASTPTRTALGKHRRGALTQASLLLATSLPTRTSPVVRGKFILTQLLCRAPPPPPANVPDLPTVDPNAVTDRQRLDAHVALPSCAACHNIIDPLGYALGHFDGIGQWRDLDHGQAIDASGTTPDGAAFADIDGLAAALSTDPHFVDCALQQMFAYALGRAMLDADAGSFTALAGKPPTEAGLVDLVRAIVFSAPFRGRQREST